MLTGMVLTCKIVCWQCRFIWFSCKLNCLWNKLMVIMEMCSMKTGYVQLYMVHGNTVGLDVYIFCIDQLSTIRMNGYTFEGNNWARSIFVSLGVNLRERICSFRSKSLALRINSILAGLRCTGKQIWSHLSFCLW